MEMRTLSTNQLKTPGLLSVLLIAGSNLECGVLEESTGLISKMAEQHSVLQYNTIQRLYLNTIIVKATTRLWGRA